MRYHINIGSGSKHGLQHVAALCLRMQREETLTMQFHKTVLAAVLATALAAPTLAKDQVFTSAEFNIEGVRAYCGNEMLKTTMAEEADTLIGFPQPSNLTINAPVFATLPVGVRLFVYYHACGMMVYRNPSLSDLSAVRVGVRDRWLSVADIEAICASDLLVEAGWENAPDAERCDAIKQTMREQMR